MVEQLARFLGVACDKAQLESLTEHCHQLVDQCCNAEALPVGRGMCPHSSFLPAHLPMDRGTCAPTPFSTHLPQLVPVPFPSLSMPWGPLAFALHPSQQGLADLCTVLCQDEVATCRLLTLGGQCLGSSAVLAHKGDCWVPGRPCQMAWSLE